MFEKGLRIRGEMFGAELAEKNWAAADDFNRPFEELVNQYCFGEIWAGLAWIARRAASSRFRCSPG